MDQDIQERRRWDFLSRFRKGSWEEKAFEEDVYGVLGGSIWPPRSYYCSFCKREFRSAQALGGHMNVHRRDRARLKQSLIINHDHNDCKILLDSKISSLSYNNHDHISNPSSTVIISSLDSRVAEALSDDHEHNKTSFHGVVDSKPEVRKNKKELEDSDDHDVECIGHDDYDDGYNVKTDLSVGRPTGTSRNEEISCKRRKIDVSSLSSCFVNELSDQGLKHGSIVDLDLELRLGIPLNPPKVNWV